MKKMAVLMAMVVGLTVLFTGSVFAGGGFQMMPYFEGKWMATLNENDLEQDKDGGTENAKYEVVIAPVQVQGSDVSWCSASLNVYDQKFVGQLGSGSLSWLCGRKYIQGYIRLDDGQTYTISFFYEGDSMKGRYLNDKWVPVDGTPYWDVVETASGKITLKRQ